MCRAWFLISCKRVVKTPLHRQNGRTDVEKSQDRQAHVDGIQPGSDQQQRDEEGQAPDSDSQTVGRPSQEDEGFKRRHRQRLDNGTTSRKTDTKDPHGRIPHASSGKTAHVGRGGFPSPLSLILRISAKVFPQTFSRISAIIRKNEDETTHTPHSFKKLEKTVKDTFAGYKDDAEEKKANKVRWLPPGLRSVVVGRNSQFFEEELHDDDLLVLGSLEYRATRLLSLILVIVSFTCMTLTECFSTLLFGF